MKKLAIGLMSGTSGDGVSVAVVSFHRRRFDLIHYETLPYPPSLSKTVLMGPYLKTPELSRLNILLGEFFSRAVLKTLEKEKIPPPRITVIGSHGQTVCHGPADHPPHTLQVGEPSLIAHRTGIPVVADFRMRDLAAGGEGAPLIPFFDHYFFGKGPIRAMQNIGGIANVTIVGKSIQPLAFDNGPGNCLIDGTVQHAPHLRLRYDPQGRIARRGVIDMKAIREMSQHPYFAKKPPKSTGRELFNASFIPSRLRDQKLEERAATLTFFTAWTIRKSYQRFISQNISEVIVSGGGALNQTLMGFLRNLFSPIPVHSIDAWGIPVQAKEPIAFAFLGLRTLEGKINHRPSGTGARKACILGKIIPGNRAYAIH